MALLAGPDATVNSQYDVIINAARHGLSALQNGELKNLQVAVGDFSYAEQSIMTIWRKIS
jgi:hypothetical protein